MKTDQQVLAARDRMLAQRNACKALFFATQNDDNTPEASHAPSLYYEDSFWLFLSTLSAHTRNIQRNRQLSVLVVDPDEQGANAFARRRQTILCTAETEATTTADYAAVMEKLTAEFGETVELMRQLSDFALYRLTLVNGRYIEGFGQAYELSGDALLSLTHIGPERFKPTTDT